MDIQILNYMKNTESGQVLQTDEAKDGSNTNKVSSKHIPAEKLITLKFMDGRIGEEPNTLENHIQGYQHQVKVSVI